ncbi:T9SS type B sorting domain-containing protein [Maribacter algarum]|nr:T9SS type B sorting domain-containing protein [Maribacter algarum]
MKNLLSIILFLTYFYASAQQANDCVDAIVVCGNTNISTNVSGFGIQELDATTNPCTYEELNSLWLNVTIATGGSLAFTIRPDDTNLEVDYDFYVFGPNNGCGNFDNPIRCNTTNPLQASLNYNTTGLRDSSIDPTGGPGEDGDGYVSSIPVTAGEQFYILIDRPIGKGGFSLEWTGTAGFLPAPDVNKPSNIEVCSEDGSSSVDLTQQEALITTSSIANIDYFNNYEDAFDETNAIVDPTQFPFIGTTSNIYVRVTNPNGCFEIVDFAVMPLLFDSPPNLSYTSCDVDRDGQADFDTTEITTDGENTIANPMEFQFSLHSSEAEATANSNPILGPTLSSASATIYARVSSSILSSCFITYPISLNLTTPEFAANLSLVQCDVDQDNSSDGITKLDLEQVFQNNPDVTVYYYETVADRTTDNPIANPNSYSNTTAFNAIVYYRAESNNCESLGEIAIEVNPTTISLNTASPIQACDDDPTDSVHESNFDLESIRQNNYAGLDVAFYGNLVDVSLEQNPLEGNYRTGSTTLYVRLETNNQCQGVEEIELIVNPLPEVSLENNYQVCTDGEPLYIDAPSGFDSYVWYKIDSGLSQELSNTMQVTITEGGNYRLEVETQYQNNGQGLSCTASTDFVVAPSNRATIQEVKIEESSNGNTVIVEVSGEGDYEYALDAGNYQDESKFDNVEAGFYTVFVRDKNGCGISEQEISVIGFPKFFTPNGDGANDTWQIIGANKNFSDEEIQIFDRYGKLVKQISTNSIGWDGLMNGRLLPSSDYWFRITLDSGKEFKGHFSLKR